MRKNLLKEKLKGGGIAVGVLTVEPTIQQIEILGILGFDYVNVDCLHSPMSIENVAHVIMAAELRGITPLVRVPQIVPEIVGRYMDVGAMGIFVAETDAAETAQKAVRCIKYPPMGDRGLAPVRAADFGLMESLTEYVKIANSETMVIAIIESKKGVENIGEILSTEGLDAVVIGTSDLSQSLGVAGQRNHPLVLEAIDEILAAAKKTGKAVGMPVRGDDTPKQFIEKGFTLVSTTINGLVINAGREFVTNARS